MKALIVLLVLAAGGGAAYWQWGRDAGVRSPADDVPTFTVGKDKFVRRVNAEGNLRAVKATKLTAPQSSDEGGPMKIAWIVPDGTMVKKDEVVVKFDPSDRQKALREGETDLDSASSRLAEENIKSKALVDGRASDAELAAAELDQQRHFQAKDEQLYSRREIIESQLDEHLATAKKDHAEHAKEIEKRLSQSKADLIGVEQQKARIAIDHAKKDLASMEVRAPHDGIFVLERNWRGDMARVGDQMWPGQRIAELPLLDSMEAELFVLEVDGSGLANEQPAEVLIEARPDAVYKGKIRMVDKLAKPRLQGVPVQYFAVVVALDKTDRDVMKPGQRVRGTLILDQEDALVVPREAITNKDGKNLVWKKTEHGFDTVPVELGAGTSGRVVVKSGLAEGDVIALRDPTKRTDEANGSGSGSGSAKK